MKKTILITILLILLFISCNPVDLRPPSHRSDTPAKVDIAKAEVLYKQALSAMGGFTEFAKYKKITVSFQDQWNSVFQRWMAMPWPKSGIQLKAILYPFRQTPEVYFKQHLGDGLQGYKIFNSEVYYIYKHKIVNEGKDNMRFWLLSIENFFLIPFNLHDNTVMSFGGEGTAFGNVYDLVYITWNKYQLQNNVDQYLLWINRKTSLVDMVQYTIREKLSVLYGTLRYSDFKKVGKLLLPHKHELLQDPENHRPIREIKIEKFELSSSAR